MAARVIAALALIVVGGALDVPIASLFGAVVLLLEGVHAAWARRGLGAVRYGRSLGACRTPFGGEIPLGIEVWNRSRLPVAWLRADDETSFGVVVRERELVDAETLVDAEAGADADDGADAETGAQAETGADADAGGVLRNAWTLRPFERVTRTFHVSADRRGVFLLGPVELAVGDPFAREAASEARPAIDQFLVWPKTVSVTEVEPPSRWGTEQRARTGLAEDPSRFLGTRAYVPGDPLRRVHARTSARLGHPMTKRFEPSREREVLIAVDVQTMDGPAWDAGFGDDETVEALYVVAASLARTLAERRVAFGLVAAGFTGAESRFATVPVSSAEGQAERVLDLLARLSTHASAPFQTLLAMAARSVHPGTTVLVLTARDPRPFATSFRHLRRLGGDVVVIACGRDAATRMARARAAGFTARRARLDGPWRLAEQLVIGP